MRSPSASASARPMKGLPRRKRMPCSFSAENESTQRSTASRISPGLRGCRSAHSTSSAASEPRCSKTDRRIASLLGKW